MVLFAASGTLDPLRALAASRLSSGGLLPPSHRRGGSATCAVSIWIAGDFEKRRPGEEVKDSTLVALVGGDARSEDIVAR
jgi:hypothetical protein